MGDTYRIYGEVRVPEKTPDMMTLVFFKGCNDEKHAWNLQRVFFLENDEVAFASDVTTFEAGLCDHTCGSQDLGFFTFSAVEKTIREEDGESGWGDVDDFLIENEPNYFGSDPDS